MTGLCIVWGGNVCIKDNVNLGPYFPTHKGQSQGDSLCPLIFHLATNSLAMLMDKARVNDLIKGVLGEKIEHGINMLLYVDDTIFLLQDDYDSAHNLKFMLYLFEQMSGLKFNFHEWVFCLFGDVINKAENFDKILTCHVGSLPMRHLGLLVDEEIIRNKIKLKTSWR